MGTACEDFFGATSLGTRPLITGCRVRVPGCIAPMSPIPGHALKRRPGPGRGFSERGRWHGLECAVGEGWLRGGDLEGAPWLIVVWGVAFVAGSVVGLSRLCLWVP